MKVLSISKVAGQASALSTSEIVFVSGNYSFIATFSGSIPEGDELKGVKKALLFAALHQKEAAESAEGSAVIYKALKVDTLGIISAINLKNISYIVDGKTLFKGLVAPVGAVVSGAGVLPQSIKHIEKKIFASVKAFEKAARRITIENLNAAIIEAEAEAETENEAPQVEATEAPKVDNKKAEGRKKAEAQAAARRAKHAEEAKAFEA